MGQHAHIGTREVTIDTSAWLGQRTGGVITDLTASLHAWATTPADGQMPPSDDTAQWKDLIRSWCHAHGYTSPDPDDPNGGPDFHDLHGTRLRPGIWVARARTTDWGKIAVVVRGIRAPEVLADTARETADWLDTSVCITCPSRHAWTWLDNGDLAGSDGTFVTLTSIWGDSPDVPFTPCGTCTAVLNGHRREACRCDGSSWIVCPVCGARCDVHLPCL